MKGQKLTIQAIRSRDLEIERGFYKFGNLWGTFVFRNISHYLAWLFVRLGISANRVTEVSLIAELASFVFLAMGSYTSAIIGALLINTWCLLDHVDGIIARSTNSTSKYGEFVDYMGGTLAALLFASIGIGLFHHPDPFMNWLTSYFPGLDIEAGILFLGVWASLFFILPLLMRAGVGGISHLKSGDVVARNRALYYLEIIGFNLFSFGGVPMPLVLLAAIFKFLSIVIVAYALINTGFFIGSFILLIHAIRRSKSQ